MILKHFVSVTQNFLRTNANSISWDPDSIVAPRSTRLHLRNDDAEVDSGFSLSALRLGRDALHRSLSIQHRHAFVISISRSFLPREFVRRFPERPTRHDTLVGIANVRVSVRRSRRESNVDEFVPNEQRL